MTKNTLSFWLLAGAGGLLITGCCCGGRGPSEKAVVVASPQPPPVQLTPTSYPVNEVANPVNNGVVYPVNEVVMVDPAPQPAAEVIEVLPNEARVWVSGSWIRTDQRWVWLPAREEVWERPGARESRAMGGVADFAD